MIAKTNENGEMNKTEDQHYCGYDNAKFPRTNGRTKTPKWSAEKARSG